MRTPLLITLLALILVGCEAPTTLSEAVAMAPTTADAACDSSATPFGGGNGTTDSPFLVCSVAQLKRLDTHYIESFALAASLNLSGETNWKALAQFSGSFDGRGYTLSNLRIRNTSPNSSSIGLWASVGQNGVVKNLRLLNVDVQGGNAGAVSAYVHALATVQAVQIVSGVVKGASNVGGLVGENYGDVIDCANSATITATGISVGGVVGFNGGHVQTSDSSKTATGFNYFGRVVGNNSGRVDDCQVSGLVSSSEIAIGLNSHIVNNCN